MLTVMPLTIDRIILNISRRKGEVHPQFQVIWTNIQEWRLRLHGNLSDNSPLQAQIFKYLLHLYEIIWEG